MSTLGKQNELNQLNEMNHSQDILNVFITTILHKSSTIYVLVNIILCIWLAQTIFSSNLKAIPRSIYLISPFFGELPINDIKVVLNEEHQCPRLYEHINLKSFPTIINEHIPHQYLDKWGIDEIIFCVKRVNLSKNINISSELCKEQQCNGFCFKEKNDCPITKISLVNSHQPLNKFQNVFFIKDHQKYIYSKSNGRLVVGLLSTFSNLCAKDFKYYDQYKILQSYLQQINKCQRQGSISSFYSTFDRMNTSRFLYNNGIPLKVPYKYNSIEIGTIFEIDFNQKLYKGCSKVLNLATKTQTYLFSNPVQPLMTQNLLVVSFVFLVLQIIWFLAYYCCKGNAYQKNIMVILLAIIQLIVISYIYNENRSLFQTEKVVLAIAHCIQKDITAAQHWNFGIQSSNSFIMVQFVSVIFLATYLLALIIDRCVFLQPDQYPRYQNNINEND